MTPDATPRVRQITNFAVMPEPDLLVMLHTGRPKTIRRVAQIWGAVHVSLTERADDMETQFARMRERWSGRAAAHYEDALIKLTKAMRSVADLAAVMRDLTFSVAEWLEAAQAAIPRPVGMAPEQMVDPLQNSSGRDALPIAAIDRNTPARRTW